MDYSWMSKGGLTLDGTGDINFTPSDLVDIQSMCATRLKADLNAWQLYQIGANLVTLLGKVATPELEAAALKLVQSALTNQLLPASAFIVKTIVSGNLLSIFIYLSKSKTLLYTTTVTI